MEEMILQFITTYGWKLACISCLGIFILGVLKFFKVFDKIKKENRKYVYTAVSAGISILASAIYLLVIGEFDFRAFSVMAGAIYLLNQSIYSLYETLGVRAGVKKLGKFLVSVVAKKQIEEERAKIEADEVVE